MTISEQSTTGKVLKKRTEKELKYLLRKLIQFDIVVILAKMYQKKNYEVCK